MKYHAHLSPRELSTVTKPLEEYPARWELMAWYVCWRKHPYAAEIHAALVAETRSEAYSHYPCPLDSTHWHIGRGGKDADPRKRLTQAKRTYRKAVRDEIWRAHVVREEERSRERREAAPALAD